MAYSEPLPHNGGTDAISILGRPYLDQRVSARDDGDPVGSAANLPRCLRSDARPCWSSIATVTPFFYDEDPAVVANVWTSQWWRDSELWPSPIPIPTRSCRGALRASPVTSC